MKTYFTVIILLFLSSPCLAEAGQIIKEYQLLIKKNCDFKKYIINTALEARVLKNVPFALKGYHFKSKELQYLFKSEGMIAQTQNKIILNPVDQKCVAKLKVLENSLRKKVKMSPQIEALFIRYSSIFTSLRMGASPGTKLRREKEKITHNSMIWNALDKSPQSCRGDGSPDQAGDCGGISIECNGPIQSKKWKKIRCEVTWAG